MKQIEKLKITHLAQKMIDEDQQNALKGGTAGCVCVGCLCGGTITAMDNSDKGDGSLACNASFS